MTTIGTFRFEPATQSYSGYLTLLGLPPQRVHLMPAEPKLFEDDADYVVRLGTPAQRIIGLAWEIGSTYHPCVRLHLDDPGFAAPIDAVLWRPRPHETAKLEWYRLTESFGAIFRRWLASRFAKRRLMLP